MPQEKYERRSIVYVPDLTEALPGISEVISPEEKSRLFYNVRAELYDSLYPFGVFVPPMYDRAAIVNFETFRDVLVQQKHREPDNRTLGWTLMNGIILINMDGVTDSAERHGIPLEDTIQHVIGHETLHSLEYREAYIKPGLDPLDTVIRAGISSRLSPRTNLYSLAMNQLREGFHEWWLKNKTNLTSNLPESPAQDELEVVDLLIGKTEIEPWIDGMFKKDGLQSFFGAFKKKFGVHGMSQLSVHMYQDLSGDEIYDPDFQGHVYPRTMRFLTDLSTD